MKTNYRVLKNGICFTMWVLVMAALSGCAEELSQLVGSRTQVEIVPQFVSMDGGSTRAADNLDVSSTGFSCLYAAEAGAAASPNSKAKIMIDDGSSSYMPYTYRATGSSALTVEGDAPTFPPAVDEVHVYGWYPYTASTSFTIQTNQSTTRDYCLSDLMLADMASCTRNASSVTAAALAFRHVMSKVKIVLTPGSGVTVTEVKLKNVAPTVAIDESDVSALSVGAASGSAGDVTLLSGGSLTSASAPADRTLCGVFPAQTISSSFITVTASIGGTPSTITYSFGAGSKTFVSGKEYTVNLSVSATQTGSPTVSLPDWTGAEGTVNIGGGGGGDAPTLSPTSLTLTYGDAASNIIASGVGTAWTALSANTSVATVSGTGPISVTPAGVGSTTIHVWPTAGVTGGFSTASCAVTVNALALQTSSSSNNGYVTFGSIVTQQWTGSAVEPAAPTITVKVNSGNETLTAADYDISYSNNVNEGSSAVMTITGKGKFTGSVSTNFTIIKDPGISLASATVGMVIGANGKAYSTIAQANIYSSAAAIIAYKGNGEANSSYNTGLAISLADGNGGSTCKWYTENSGTCVAQSSDFAFINTDLKGIEYTNKLANATCGSGHDHAAAKICKNYTSTMATPTGCSQWFLPTIGQWKRIAEAMCGGSNLTTASKATYRVANFNKKIRVAYGVSESTACAGDLQGSRYWSSVGASASAAWSVDFMFGGATNYDKSDDRYVRPVLAF